MGKSQKGDMLKPQGVRGRRNKEPIIQIPVVRPHNMSARTLEIVQHIASLQGCDVKITIQGGEFSKDRAFHIRWHYVENGRFFLDVCWYGVKNSKLSKRKESVLPADIFEAIYTAVARVKRQERRRARRELLANMKPTKK